MRIGLVAPPWVPVPPPAYGGTEEVVDLLARGLRAEGHEVLLAASADSTCPVARVDGTQPSDPGLTNDATSLAAQVVTAYAAMDEVDLVHDHTVAGPLYRGRPPGTPVVVTQHNAFSQDAITALAAAAADTAVVAISHDHAARAGDVPIARVIHHGLDLDRIPVGDGQGGYAVFLGRMDPDKGAAEAVRIARAAGVPLRLAAKMRTRDEHDYFEAEVRPLLTREHEYVGEVSGAEKLRLLGGAMALLNPIRWAEPFGLAMVEALATGTPVVGTPNGSAPEIVDHGATGFLADAGELASLLARVAELDRAACRSATEERFSAGRMVRDHLSLYRTLVGG
ncbi:D-inositol-3-phosphate glycosyltransferase [Propionicimonas sp. T2.31MG-18]|uniref:glycosyltransferase family 4 protein n=1 Tax=Propionicimonas sp. T2.31MG-18 TaxID=3157620 RepID=UPI0035E993BE